MIPPLDIKGATDSGSAMSGNTLNLGSRNSPALLASASWLPLALGAAAVILALWALSKIAHK